MAFSVKRFMKRLALGLVVVFVLLLVYCNLPEHLVIRSKISSLRKTVASYKYDDAWQLFALEDSVQFILADEKPSVREQLAGANVTQDLDGFLEKDLYERFLNNSRDAGTRLMESARLFWNGFEEFRIDYDEPFDENPHSIRIVGVSSTAPAGIEFDIYYGVSGKPIYPLPRSILYATLADVLAERGDITNSYYYAFEAVLDDAQFGQLGVKTLERLLPIPRDVVAGTISWYSNLASLLDTIHSPETVEIARKLINDAANSKLITSQEKDGLVRECDAIAAFVSGDYLLATSKFQANLTTGLPGTAFYLALSSYRVGIIENSGANMLDISENLMKELVKKKRQD